MRRIPLTQGREALVDACDYNFLMQWKWCITVNGYATRNLKSRGMLTMHRAVVGRYRGNFQQVDHINGDRIDNRRSNLRHATASQNGRNRGKNKNNTSGHKGVWWNKRRKKFYAAIKVNRKSIHLGVFDDPKKASEVYKQAALELHKEFANVT